MEQTAKYGLKTMPSQLYGTLLGFFGFLITFAYLPQYATWIALLSLADTFTTHISIASPISDHTEFSVSEAYHNGKMNLCRYHVAQSMKWRFFVDMFFGLVIVIAIPAILDSLLDIFGENWLLAIPLFPITALPQFINIFKKPVSFTKLGKPLYDQVLGVVFATASFLWYLFLIYLVNYNLNIYIFALKDIPILLIRMLVEWILVDRKMFKIKPKNFALQVYIIPIIPLVLSGLFLYAYSILVFPLGATLLGPIPFAIISAVIALFFLPSILLCPLMGFFGCWDKYTIETMREAVPLCGPSKFVLGMMYKATVYFYKLSPFKGKFKIKGSKLAIQEASDLENEKMERDFKNIKAKTN